MGAASVTHHQQNSTGLAMPRVAAQHLDRRPAATTVVEWRGEVESPPPSTVRRHGPVLPAPAHHLLVHDPLLGIRDDRTILGTRLTETGKALCGCIAEAVDWCSGTAGLRRTPWLAGGTGSSCFMTPGRSGVPVTGGDLILWSALPST